MATITAKVTIAGGLDAYLKAKMAEHIAEAEDAKILAGTPGALPWKVAPCFLDYCGWVNQPDIIGGPLESIFVAVLSHADDGGHHYRFGFEVVAHVLTKSAPQGAYRITAWSPRVFAGNWPELLKVGEVKVAPSAPWAIPAYSISADGHYVVSDHAGDPLLEVATFAPPASTTSGLAALNIYPWRMAARRGGLPVSFRAEPFDPGGVHDFTVNGKLESTTWADWWASFKTTMGMDTPYAARTPRRATWRPGPRFDGLEF